MPNLDKAISNTVVWADLATPDVDKARAFYGELLGWSYTGGDDPQTGFYTTGNRNGRRVAALWKKPPEMPVSAWTIYIGTDSVDDSASKVKAAGGQVLQAPMDVMEYGRMAVFADPTGAVFGVWQSKSHTGAQIINEPGAMAWHEVYSRDALKACDFYQQVFGLEPQKMDGSGDTQYWTLQRGDEVVAGAMQMGATFPKDVPSHWNTYFAVSDTDAASKRLEQLGGKVFQPPFDTPYGRMSAVADPFGATFCLIKPTY